jgi:endonuclease YncB( thermonuclease family)
MRRLAILWLGSCAGALSGSFPLSAMGCNLSEPETGTVAAIIDGETLKLADGRTVRLIGAKAPMPPLGFRGEDPWPLVEEAKEALTRLAAGKEVELRYGGTRTARHGYALAHVFVVDGVSRLWLQQEMVKAGLARVYSFSDNRACVGDLLASEGDARGKGLGVWGSPVYRIASAEDVDRLGRLTQTYQLVEGRVVSVGEGAGRVYLNFARDWKSDFTISNPRKDANAFQAEGIDLKALAGKRVRVRGWVIWRNGPMIEATHPEQIEILTDDQKADDARTRRPQEPGPDIAL